MTRWTLCRPSSGWICDGAASRTGGARAAGGAGARPVGRVRGRPVVHAPRRIVTGRLGPVQGTAREVARLTNPILDRVIDRESFREIIAGLTPGQVFVVVLRADGLNDQEIADLAGLCRQAVPARIRKAAWELGQDPGLAPYVEGRSKQHGRTAQPHDAFENPKTECDLSSGEVAKLFEVSGRTVFDWVQAGRLPNAFQTPSRRWRIPARDLRGFDPPGRGRRWG